MKWWDAMMFIKMRAEQRAETIWSYFHWNIISGRLSNNSQLQEELMNLSKIDLTKPDQNRTEHTKPEQTSTNVSVHVHDHIIKSNAERYMSSSRKCLSEAQHHQLVFQQKRGLSTEVHLKCCQQRFCIFRIRWVDKLWWFQLRWKRAGSTVLGSCWWRCKSAWWLFYALYKREK